MAEPYDGIDLNRLETTKGAGEPRVADVVNAIGHTLDAANKSIEELRTDIGPILQPEYPSPVDQGIKDLPGAPRPEMIRILMDLHDKAVRIDGELQSLKERVRL